MSRTECLRHIPASEPPPISWRSRETLSSFQRITYIIHKKKCVNKKPSPANNRRKNQNRKTHRNVFSTAASSRNPRPPARLEHHPGYSGRSRSRTVPPPPALLLCFPLAWMASRSIQPFSCVCASFDAVPRRRLCHRQPRPSPSV